MVDKRKFRLRFRSGADNSIRTHVDGIDVTVDPRIHAAYNSMLIDLSRLLISVGYPTPEDVGTFANSLTDPSLWENGAWAGKPFERVFTVE